MISLLTIIEHGLVIRGRAELSSKNLNPQKRVKFIPNARDGAEAVWRADGAYCP
jgi:hypothetical protein